MQDLFAVQKLTKNGLTQMHVPGINQVHIMEFGQDPLLHAKQGVEALIHFHCEPVLVGQHHPKG